MENQIVNAKARSGMSVIEGNKAIDQLIQKETKLALSKAERVKFAEMQVHAYLNYGGIFLDGGPTSQDLELAYNMGDLEDEIPQMRLLAAALVELADALELE